MLELGSTRREKRRVLVGLTLFHVLALGSTIALFASGPELSPLPTVAAVVAITVWLFTFVLLCVNVVYYVMGCS